MMNPRHRFLLRRTSRVVALLATAVLSGVPQVLAENLPTGGSVAAGSAGIGTATNNSLTVTQSSSSAVINWQSFSVGSGYSVNFIQPSSSAALLNRVTGATPSTIAGTISANGQVYLINPNGIAITSTGVVNAAGFVASTLNIGDDDFMAGKRTFTGTGASAAATNAGTITIGRGGYAALLGGSVDNAGTIAVPLGKVGLGSGERATLDLSGDGFLQVAIPTAAAGSGGLVANSGTISADGGVVQLSAAAAKDMARQAINMSGAIEAKTVGGTSGDVVLAGADGAVEISGTIDVTGDEGAGGAIAVTGREIALTDATLDASGTSGGGTVKVGGDRRGTGTLQHADTVTIDAQSTIRADATQSGDGGDVVVWSDELTTFAGTISAKGGAASGDGGQAEVSGKKTLSYTGFTDLSAAHGSFGTLLLDPYNVTISDGTDTSGFTAGGDDSVIHATTLLTALASANVAISTGSGGAQSGDITVAAALSWSSGSTLTLDAANSIAIDAAITVAGSGGLALTYGGDLTFGSGAGVTYTNADGSAATSSQGGTLTTNGTGYTLLYSMAEIDAIDSDLSGAYALAASLDASGTPYADALVAGGDGSTSFTGAFEGLGNTITGLTISKTSDGYAGLFGIVGSGGVVRDINLVGGSVSGISYHVGGLVGENDGTIIGASSSATVTATSANAVGGLVGDNEGTITDSYATGSASGAAYVGGLAGYNAGTIGNAYATGAVSGTADVGGLAGISVGTIANAYATGAVTATATDSYVGGLVGVNYGAIGNAYATGAVKGVNYVGGLVGDNAASSISNAYATGSVTGTRYVGGLVGVNGATISKAYATGAVSGSLSAGGLVGSNSSGTVSNSYWDKETSGQSSSSGGGTSLTTAQLQDGGSASGLGSAFTLISGLYPYLTSLFPDGVQVISGIAYKDVGSTVAASGAGGAVTVTAIAGGTTFGTATTGANGYYYIFGAAGTFASGDSLLTYTTADAATGAANAATLGTATSAVLQSGFKLYGGMLAVMTDAATWSAAPALSSLKASALAAAGSDAAAATVINATGSQGIVSTVDFTVDQTLDVTGTLLIATATGKALTVAEDVDIEAGASLTLSAGGRFSIDAPITVYGTGELTLFYGSISYGTGATVTYTDRAGTLTINGVTYTLLYSMADIDAIDSTGLSGNYALATSIDATGTTYPGALVSGTYTGTFEGLNNTITGLTIVGSDDYTALFDTVGGAGKVSNIGLVGGSISSTGDYVGSLAGDNDGTISNVFSTAAVSGHDYVGGLVGVNYGDITNAYALGAVTGNSSVGGLVGENDWHIGNVFSAGAVSGTDTSTVGGLVGYSNDSITNAYWDTETSGQSVGIGQDDYDASITGLTTAQLQDGSSASGLGSAFTRASGLYPYLTSFFPDGVQAISGTAYKDVGSTVAASGAGGAVTVTAIAGGTTFGTATTGANGYYYIFGAAGTFASGDSLLTYTTADAATGAANAATLGTATSAVLQSGFKLYGGMLAVMTDAATWSAAPALSSLKASALAAAGSDAAAATAINATGSQGIVSAVDFTVDQTLDVTGTLLITTAAGKTLTVAEDVDIEAGASLTLSSGGWLDIDAPVTVRGAGAVVLAYDTSNAAKLTFGNGTNLTYANADGSAAASSQGGTLRINGDDYTLLYSMSELAGLPTSTIVSLGITGHQGNYALAVSLDASGVTYTDALIGAGTTLYGDGDYHPFVGIFEGLGHTITGLTIVKSGDYAGLLGANGGGTVRDIGLIGASVSGENYVGSLVGYNSGTIVNAYATGTVSGGGSSWDVGGLVGRNYEGGIIASSYDASTVSGSWYVGGLVGANYGGTVTDSYATGAVSGSTDVGGLAGENYKGAISGSYATGAVGGSTNVGGLVGINLDGIFVGGTITDAYATGSVSGGSETGGLVGANYGSITDAYATGAVSGSSDVGGLVGYSTQGSMTNVFATGAVRGDAYVGGLVGYNDNASAITNAYAIGAVSGHTSVGGLVGWNASTGTVANGYWDPETSGHGSGIGTDSNGQSVTALTTAQFQDGASASGLGSAFTLTSGLFPYLSGLFSNGVQAVSGYAYTDTGSAPLTSGSSGAGVVTVVLADGEVITATTGANGYYYAFFANGGIDTANGSSVLAYTTANASTGATFIAKATGSLTGFNVYGDVLTETADSSVATLSALDSAYAALVSGTAVDGLSFANRAITAFATGFNIDRAASVSGTLVVSVSGDLTIAAAGNVSGADVSLQAAGTFINESGSDAVSATNRWLIYLADPDGDTFDDLNSGNAAIWNTAAGAAVSASGNRYVFAVQPTLTVSTVDADKTYGDDGTANLTAYYTVTGLSSGVAGAFLADSAVGTLSGTVSLSSGGLATSASVGSYGYTLGLGTLTAANGYTISLSNAGTLTVSARPITVTANSLRLGLNAAIPALTYTVGGSRLANGDGLSGSLATSATSTSNVGIYAITQGSLQASTNYTMTFVPGLLMVTAEGLIDAAALASTFIRVWPINTPEAALTAPSGTLNVNFSDNGPEGFASPRFDGGVVCRGDENCVSNISAAKD